VEVPSTVELLLPDVPLIAEAAARFDAILAVDATVATPYNFRGLDMDFDISIHSSSKFLGGRYDHLGGVICSRSEALLDGLRAILDALDLGMCANQRAILDQNLRGFEARMKAINANAAGVVDALRASPKIDQVRYPGIHLGKQAELASALLHPGRSGLVSFALKEKGIEPLRRFYDGVRPPLLKGPGFGGETSLLYPCTTPSRRGDIEETAVAQGLAPSALRLSVGTEPAEDILAALGVAI
jgi:cystathionine gamma-synthase